MKRLKLIRTEMGAFGTFGRMEIAGETFVTGELPAKDNAAMISSIPAGVYRCRRTMSNRFKRMLYEVLNVPGRTGIRFHSANHMGDVARGLKCELNGCIALGTTKAIVNGQMGIGGSRVAMDRFDELLAGADFELEIVDEYLEAGKPGGNVG